MLTIIVAAAIHGGCCQIIEYYEKENSFFSFFSLSIYTSPIATITCSATATCTATSGVNMVQVLKKKQIELKSFLYLLVSFANT